METMTEQRAMLLDSQQFFSERNRLALELRRPDKDWTYPLIAFMGVGALMCVTFGMRQLTKSPDVKWNKELRRSNEIAAAKEQTQWMTHRKTLKNMRENAVNTNRSQ